jgi:hypothetical protein
MDKLTIEREGGWCTGVMHSRSGKSGNIKKRKGGS